MEGEEKRMKNERRKWEKSGREGKERETTEERRRERTDK